MQTPDSSSPTQARFNPILLLFLIFPLLGVTAAIVMMFSAPPSDPALASTPGFSSVAQMNFAAPNIQLTLLDTGEPAQIADYRGRVVFLNFWATWCEPCQRELPALAQFVREQDPETGAIVLALNSGERPERIRTYLTENGITDLPVLVDMEDVGRSVYGVINLPWTFVIDAEGVVRARKIGEITLEELYAYLEQVSAD